MSETNIVKQRMAAVFNEWNRRAVEDPEGFGESVNPDGTPDMEYGEACAEYFAKLMQELDQAGHLPGDGG